MIERNEVYSNLVEEIFEEQDQKFILGDSLSGLKKIDNESVDLIITSPPYNVGKEYEKKVSIEKYLKEQENVIDELIRVLSRKGSICWQVGNYVNNGEIYPLDIFYYKIFKDRGMQLRNRIIWHFGHGLHASKRFSGRYETILWFSKTNEYTFNLDDVRIPAKYPGKRHFKGDKRGELSGNPLGKNPSDTWEFLQNEWESCFWEIPNVKSMHPEKTAHPCQFPIELVERCVLALTREGDTVLDPYAGVASTSIASLKNNRKSICFEREPSYWALGVDRIKKFESGNLKTREMGTEIYKPTGNDKVSKIPDEWKSNGGEK
jgi:adenine-specific DNA-methyltransferase